MIAPRRRAARPTTGEPEETLCELGVAVLDAIPVNLYLVDRQLRVVAWNSSREQGPIGQPRGNVLGRHLSRVLPEKGFRATAQLLHQVFRTGMMHEDTKEAGVGRRLFKARRLPVRHGRRVTHVLSLFEDVTEQRAMEMRLIASDRLAFLGQLVAGVAHEVANPLSSISGCAEALASLAVECPKPGSRKEAEEFRRLIREEVARCERILRTLLGSARPHPEGVSDVAQTVHTVMWLLGRHPAFTRVKVVRRIPETLPAVRIDSDSLKQVVLALATNGARAMRGGGTLTLRAQRKGRHVVLDVSDTGTGIPRHLRERIFEPFFTTDSTQGTGLGLAIARSLVHGRGGDLICRARRRGAAFRVTLPIAKEAA